MKDEEKILGRIGAPVTFGYPSEEGNESGVLRDRYVLAGAGGRGKVPYWDVIDLIEFPETDEPQWIRIGYYRKPKDRLVWASQTTITEPVSVWKRLLSGAARAKPWFANLIRDIAQDLGYGGTSSSGERPRRFVPSLSERDMEAIVDRFDTDTEFLASRAFLDGGLDPLSARLRRAALNQICDGEATVSRYGIWANTVRDNIREADKEIQNGNLTEARRLLRRVANSLSAFAELQAQFDTMRNDRTPQQVVSTDY